MLYDYLPAGYPLLFITSLAASSILPIGSEWLLAAMLLGGADIFTSVFIASAGNILGALSSYWIGLKGGAWVAGRVGETKAEKLRKGFTLFNKYGSWSLLFSWLPFIGDPLCVAAGASRLALVRFTIMVAAGKAARYSAVAWITLKGKETLAFISQASG